MGLCMGLYIKIKWFNKVFVNFLFVHQAKWLPCGNEMRSFGTISATAKFKGMVYRFIAVGAGFEVHSVKQVQ